MEQDQKNTTNPVSFLLKDNPVDKDWLNNGGSAMALAARRVFITTTNPNASPYDESPQELQQKYDTFWKFLKGVWSGHSPVETPKSRKILFYLKRMLFGLGNILSAILFKLPEWLFYSAQLGCKKYIGDGFFSGAFKALRFICSFISSPLNNSIRLQGSNVRSGWQKFFKFFPALMITAILMATGVGPALLALMGVSIAITLPATIEGISTYGILPAIGAAIEYALLSLTFGASTYAGFNIALQGAPSRTFQAIHENRLEIIKGAIKTAVSQEFYKIHSKTISDAVKHISTLEGRYHFEFSSQDLATIQLSIAKRINQLNPADKQDYNIVLSIIEGEFALHASKHSQSSYKAMFADPLKNKFVDEVKQSLQEIKTIKQQIKNLETSNPDSSELITLKESFTKHEERLVVARENLVNYQREHQENMAEDVKSIIDQKPSTERGARFKYGPGLLDQPTARTEPAEIQPAPTQQTQGRSNN